MINSEKYLNVSVNEFFKAIVESKIDISGLYSLEKWLLDEAKPILTEDEKVILRNMKDIEIIARDNLGDLLVDRRIEINVTTPHYITLYNHLFQFIKKRRRIFDN